MELRVGTDIGPYTVLRRLGGGSMGVVHQVRHRERDTVHALKVLRQVEPGLARRLRNEGRLQAALDHPNVVRVTDTVEVRGLPALVMEYVAGPTLAALIQGAGRLSIAEVDGLARGILRGVAAAHARGWVHRDLKPGNVLVDRDLQARVTDFGLATARDAAADAEPGTFTRIGAGTRRYMSLEQLTGGSPVPGMDVFALGALLFELLEGAPAFPTLHGWKEALRTGDYPSVRRPDVPDRMQETVAAALADASVRSIDAAALLAMWEAGTRESGDAIRPETRAVLDTAVEASEAVARTWPSDSGIAHLPPERDAFVGREEDLRLLAGRIDAGDRLLTLHGPGGIGKTRLALRFGRTSGGEYGGAWLCELVEARDVDGIVRAVARGLSVLVEGRDPVVQLGHAIAGRGKCLVVLDNFEQVAAHAAQTLGAWVDAAPEAVFLVTSRTVLGLAGERVVRLEPLDEAAATALFVERARAADVRFDPAEDPGAIGRLVDLLDGLPLAIELCAARVAILSPAGMVNRMGDRFRLLGSARGRADRHATLRAALDWSWELLTAWERSALAQCSVFAGAFALDAVEGVVDLSPFAEAPWPIDVVQALVDRSLLQARSDDDGRYRLLVSVREYAAEKLGSETATVQRRHAAWYATRADAAELAERWLLSDLDNLTVAARWGLATGDPEVGARAALGAVRTLALRGPYVEAQALLDDVQRAGAVPGELGVRLVAARAAVAMCLGDLAGARTGYLEALAAFRARGDRWREARTLGALGHLDLESGGTDTTDATLEAALAAHREVGNRLGEGRVVSLLARRAAENGRHDEALHLGEAALALAREVGDRVNEGILLNNLGTMHLGTGRIDHAERHYEAALAIDQDIGNRKHEVRALMNLANIHQLRDRSDEATALLERASRASAVIGDRRSEGIVACSLGGILLDEERFDEAEPLLRRSLELNREQGNRRFEAQALQALAMVSASRPGGSEQALVLFEEALQILHVGGNRRGEGFTWVRMAFVHFDRGDDGEALRVLRESQRALGAVGHPLEHSVGLCIRARELRHAGDLAGMEAALEEAERGSTGLEVPARWLLERLFSRIRAHRAPGVPG